MIATILPLPCLALFSAAPTSPATQVMLHHHVWNRSAADLGVSLDVSWLWNNKAAPRNCSQLGLVLVACPAGSVSGRQRGKVCQVCHRRVQGISRGAGSPGSKPRPASPNLAPHRM